MAHHVDHDAVTLGDQRNGPTVNRLGGHMAHAESMGATGEASVGNECGVATTTGALHGPGDGQHLAHAGTPLGTLVADDHDVTRLNLAAEHGRHGRVLTIEHPGPTVKPVYVYACHLDH